MPIDAISEGKPLRSEANCHSFIDNRDSFLGFFIFYILGFKGRTNEHSQQYKDRNRSTKISQ